MHTGNRNILVAVDFSPESEDALHQAVHLARHLGRDLVLAHVTALPEQPVGFPELEPLTLKDYRSRLDAEVKMDRDKLEEWRTKYSGQGVTISKVVADGFPDTTVCQIAKEQGSELVVVGTHGRTGIKWFFLGSIAQLIVRQAESDVLVARGDSVGVGGFKRICVAMDFSPGSIYALEKALPYLAKDGDVDVVHFWSLLPRFGLYEPLRMTNVGELTTSLESQIQSRGEDLIRRHRPKHGSIEFFQEQEPVLPGMVHWLERHNYDLVVLGSHGRRGFRRLVLGSVAESVVRKAPCSVLVCHTGNVK